MEAKTRLMFRRNLIQTVCAEWNFISMKKKAKRKKMKINLFKSKNSLGKAPLSKSQPTSSQVHVNAPMSDDDDMMIVKAALDLVDGKDKTANPPISNLEAMMLNAALGTPAFPVETARSGSPQPMKQPMAPPV